MWPHTRQHTGRMVRHSNRRLHRRVRMRSARCTLTMQPTREAARHRYRHWDRGQQHPTQTSRRHEVTARVCACVAAPVTTTVPAMIITSAALSRRPQFRMLHATRSAAALAAASVRLVCLSQGPAVAGQSRPLNGFAAGGPPIGPPAIMKSGADAARMSRVAVSASGLTSAASGKVCTVVSIRMERTPPALRDAWTSAVCLTGTRRPLVSQSIADITRGLSTSSQTGRSYRSPWLLQSAVQCNAWRSTAMWSTRALPVETSRLCLHPCQLHGQRQRSACRSPARAKRAVRTDVRARVWRRWCPLKLSHRPAPVATPARMSACTLIARPVLLPLQRGRHRWRARCKRRPSEGPGLGAARTRLQSRQVVAHLSRVAASEQGST
jgi:hypothetical protein